MSRLSFPVWSTYDVLPPATNLVRWNLSSDAKCRYGKRGTPKHTMQLLKSIRLIHLEAQWGFENHPRCDKQVITIVDLRQPAITTMAIYLQLSIVELLTIFISGIFGPKLGLNCPNLGPNMLLPAPWPPLVAIYHCQLSQYANLGRPNQLDKMA